MLIFALKATFQVILSKLYKMVDVPVRAIYILFPYDTFLSVYAIVLVVVGQINSEDIINYIFIKKIT
jgi:hypothetical protein